jgi:hypothetical protein
VADVFRAAASDAQWRDALDAHLALAPPPFAPSSAASNRAMRVAGRERAARERRAAAADWLGGLIGPATPSASPTASAAAKRKACANGPSADAPSAGAPPAGGRALGTDPLTPGEEAAFGVLHQCCHLQRLPVGQASPALLHALAAGVARGWGLDEAAGLGPVVSDPDDSSTDGGAGSAGPGPTGATRGGGIGSRGGQTIPPGPARLPSIGSVFGTVHALVVAPLRGDRGCRTAAVASLVHRLALSPVLAGALGPEAGPPSPRERAAAAGAASRAAADARRGFCRRLAYAVVLVASEWGARELAMVMICLMVRFGAGLAPFADLAFVALRQVRGWSTEEIAELYAQIDVCANHAAAGGRERGFVQTPPQRSPLLSLWAGTYRDFAAVFSRSLPRLHDRLCVVQRLAKVDQRASVAELFRYSRQDGARGLRLSTSRGAAAPARPLRPSTSAGWDPALDRSGSLDPDVETQPFTASAGSGPGLEDFVELPFAAQFVHYFASPTDKLRMLCQLLDRCGYDNPLLVQPRGRIGGGASDLRRTASRGELRSTGSLGAAGAKFGAFGARGRSLSRGDSFDDRPLKRSSSGVSAMAVRPDAMGEDGEGLGEGRSRPDSKKDGAPDGLFLPSEYPLDLLAVVTSRFEQDDDAIDFLALCLGGSPAGERLRRDHLAEISRGGILVEVSRRLWRPSIPTPAAAQRAAAAAAAAARGDLRAGRDAAARPRALATGGGAGARGFSAARAGRATAGPGKAPGPGVDVAEVLRRRLVLRCVKSLVRGGDVSAGALLAADVAEYASRALDVAHGLRYMCAMQRMRSSYWRSHSAVN